MREINLQHKDDMFKYIFREKENFNAYMST